MTLAAALALLSAPAHAATLGDGARDVAHRGEVEGLALDWDGTGTAVATDSFVGMPVAVPGDTASRTLVVRNDGPTAGTLTVSIVDVTMHEPHAPDHGNFYEDLRLHWETAQSASGASFVELAAAGTTVIGELALERGASTALTVTYALPVEATSGNRANVGAREAAFDVRLELSGDLPDAPEDGPGLPVTGVSGATGLLAAVLMSVGGALAVTAGTVRRSGRRILRNPSRCSGPSAS